LGHSKVQPKWNNGHKSYHLVTLVGRNIQVCVGLTQGVQEFAINVANLDILLKIVLRGLINQLKIQLLKPSYKWRTLVVESQLEEEDLKNKLFLRILNKLNINV